MKNTTDIQTLLDRYWEGETSLEEERQLKEFFAADSIPEQFRQEASFFRALRSEHSVQMPAPPAKTFPIRQVYYWAAAASVLLLLSAGIWWWSTRPDPANPQMADVDQVQPIQPDTTPRIFQPDPEPIAALETKKQKPLKPARKKVRPRTDLPVKSPDAPDTYRDPEQAIAEIKAALALLSSKIKKGKKEIDKGLHEIESLDQAIKKRSDG